MKLTKVSALNFKGSTFDTPLTAVTIIAGPNARGKSSRIESATLALCGYLPGLPKTANGIFAALASGNPMRVEVSLLPLGSLCPDVIWREWRETKGKVVFTGPEKAIMPAVAMDAAEFFALSGPDRVKYIFARCQVDLSIPTLTTTITANIKNIKLEENTPQTEQVISETAMSVGICAGKFIKSTPQEFIEILSNGLKEKLRLANENAKRMASTVQGLTQIKEDTGASGDIEQRLAAARAALDTANSEVARLKQVGMQIGADLAAAERLAGSWAGHPVPDPVAPLLAEKSELESYLAKEDSERLKVTSTDEASHYQTLATRAETAMKRRNVAHEKLSEFDKLECCPTCNAKAKGWKNAVLESLKAELQSAQSEFEILHSAASKSLKKKQDAEEAVSKENLVLATIRSSVRRLAEVNAYLRRYADEAAKQAPAQEAAAKLPSLRQRIEQARADFRAAEVVVVAKMGAVNCLDTEYKALLKQRAEASSRATALEEAAKHKAEATVLKEVVALLQALQEEIITKSVKPILDKSNELCEGILRLPLALVDGEVGMQGPTGFVGHKTLSDSEKLLTYASLSLALAAEAPFRLAVIGRFESFDYTNRLKLIDRCLHLIVRGKLDQCLFVEVSGAQNPAVGYAIYEGNDDFSLAVI